MAYVVIKRSLVALRAKGPPAVQSASSRVEGRLPIRALRVVVTIDLGFRYRAARLTLAHRASAVLVDAAHVARAIGVAKARATTNADRTSEIDAVDVKVSVHAIDDAVVGVFNPDGVISD